jgi:hypothetical protein
MSGAVVMQLVDLDIVRDLAQSHDPDAALVFVGGDCVIVSLAETAEPDTGVLIVRRREVIAADVSGGTLREDQLRALAHCLDNRARDLSD